MSSIQPKITLTNYHLTTKTTTGTKQLCNPKTGQPLYKHAASLLIEVTAEILENQFYKNDASLLNEVIADTFENPLYKNAANLLIEVTAEKT